MPAKDFFGINDKVKTLLAPSGMAAVHVNGYSWAKAGATFKKSTVVSAGDWNVIIGNMRGLFTIGGVDLSDLDEKSPLILREALTRAIDAAGPALVAANVPTILADEDFKADVIDGAAAGAFPAEVINSDATAGAGYSVLAKRLGISVHSTGSTGFPSELGMSVSFMFGGAGRAFEFWTAKSDTPAFYFRKSLIAGGFSDFVRFVDSGMKASAAEAEAGTDDEKFLTPAKGVALFNVRANAIMLSDYLIGDGVTTNSGARMTALKAAITARPEAEFVGTPGATYLLTAADSLALKRIKMRGAKFLWGGDTWATSSAACLAFTALTDIDDELVMRVLAAATARRFLDFAAGVKGEITLTADAQKANLNGSNLDRGVRFYGNDTDVTLNVSYIDYAAIAFAPSFDGLTPLRNFRCRFNPTEVAAGINLRCIDGGSLHDGRGDGDSPNKLPDPGFNIWNTSGVSNFVIVNNDYWGSGEHPGRGGGAMDANTHPGRNIKVIGNTFRLGGQTLLKFWSGSLTARFDNVTVANNHLIDGSRHGTPAFNDFGLMLQGIDVLTCEGNTVSKNVGTYSAFDAYYFSSIQRGQVNGNKAYGAMRHSFTVSEFSNGGSTDPGSVNGLQAVGNYSESPGDAHIYVECPNTSMRYITFSQFEGVGGVRGAVWDGPTARAVQPCLLGGKFSALSGTKFPTASAGNFKTRDEFSATY